VASAVRTHLLRRHRVAGVLCCWQQHVDAISVIVLPLSLSLSVLPLRRQRRVSI
jgi:hypothetical protein